MTDTSQISKLFRRSLELDCRLADTTGQDLLGSSPIDPRQRIVLAASKVSIEHGQSARLLLLGECAPNSGAALVRAQYEALIRSVWLQFCASDDEILRLAAPLNVVSEQGAKNIAGPLDMLIEIQKRAPDALHLQLSAFRDAQWKSLNSFVHAGIHPLSRVTGGFPVELAIQIAKTSNALAHLAYRVCASIAGNERLAAVTHAHREFDDCFPPLGALP